MCACNLSVSNHFNICTPCKISALQYGNAVISVEMRWCKPFYLQRVNAVYNVLNVLLFKCSILCVNAVVVEL